MEPITNFETQSLNQNLTPITPQKNLFKVLFFILLALILVITSVLTTLLVTKNKNIDPVEELTIIPSPTAIPTQTIVDETADWKTYNSTDLGLSFKYPLSWGEPKITKEDFNGRTTGNALNGKSFRISFKDIGRVVGYSKNYSNYVSTYYVGDQTNLDVLETFSKKNGEIYFTKKAVVANQETSIKTLLEYLPEASGILITSETNLNGKTEYTGIQISTYYPSLNKKINSYYNEVGENKGLETETIKLLTELKEGTSTDKEALNIYNEYQLWLSTFKFN